MLNIDEKALNYAKKNKGCFVVKTISASGGCLDIPVKSISVEFLKDFKGNKSYNLHEYDSVKVFIENGLILDDDIFIYHKIKLPLFGHMFSSKGISIKYI
ncbi:hypothetical protein HBE96_08680 [Clostridium sp. P21]|uniref:FeS cluster biogenesis domain-containing protein n=1 Tax=Clostridium muellerianum TaxID=2716538 RepID=A0A7Y0EI05_9CLOT|nr:hypothetical protein [Clostridium muellerianum]NMM62770.1 hypothetical protein [Clostridium muellerianum]